MNKNKTQKRDVGLMIVAGGIIVVGIISFFFNLTLGAILLFVGFGLLAMGYLTKNP